MLCRVSRLRSITEHETVLASTVGKRNDLLSCQSLITCNLPLVHLRCAVGTHYLRGPRTIACIRYENIHLSGNIVPSPVGLVAIRLSKVFPRSCFLFSISKLERYWHHAHDFAHAVTINEVTNESTMHAYCIWWLLKFYSLRTNARLLIQEEMLGCRSKTTMCLFHVWKSCPNHNLELRCPAAVVPNMLAFKALF